MKTKILGLLIALSVVLSFIGCGDSPSDPSPTVNLVMVKVPAGTFQRDNTPENTSTVKTFIMSDKEITRAQFLTIMDYDPSFIVSSSGTSDPVQNTTFFHAIAFCNKLSLASGYTRVYEVEGLADDPAWENLAYKDIPIGALYSGPWDDVTANWDATGYRLPTEMEWMWAAMGALVLEEGETNTLGYTKEFSGTAKDSTIDDYAWYKENSDDKTHPVGSKKYNEMKIYDMSGNVSEWCWDRWQNTLPTGPLTDYQGHATNSSCVIRGGSWLNNATSCALSSRTRGYKTLMDTDLGFRVVRKF